MNPYVLCPFVIVLSCLDYSWFFYLSMWIMFISATQITLTVVHLVPDIRGAYRLVPPIGMFDPVCLQPLRPVILTYTVICFAISFPVILFEWLNSKTVRPSRLDATVAAFRVTYPLVYSRSHHQ